MAGSLWVREIRRNKITRDVVVPCPGKDWREALAAACRALDVGVPLTVGKHHRDFKAFSLLRFLPEHFLEAVQFDRLEAEYFESEDGRKHARP